jgi:transcription-repair coupling factor (superfamily II helicase)
VLVLPLLCTVSGMARVKSAPPLEKTAPALLKSLAPPLLTDTESSRVKVAAERFIIPGDYVVNSDYGVGQYLGVRMVAINPADEGKKNTVAAVVVKYADCEITWFQKFVERELWLYRTAESGAQDLSSTLDEKKWVKRKKIAKENCQGMAANLINLLAIRSGLSRTPSVPTDPKYTDFENRFVWPPTADQITCFQEIEKDMVYSTRPMDRLICGDVGFGKTEVACRAIYRAVVSNKVGFCLMRELHSDCILIAFWLHFCCLRSNCVGRLGLHSD